MKLQVEKRIYDTLGEIYGTYHQLSSIDPTIKTLLADFGVNLEPDPSHDAAGINDDWPIGRGVFVDDNHKFVVLVNFEDHLKVVCCSSEGQLLDCIKNLSKVLSRFEKFGYAKDTSMGYLTTSPKNLGTAMTMKARL